jgi:hypothetical protein
MIHAYPLERYKREGNKKPPIYPVAPLHCTKGQLISKAIFEIINFPNFDPKNLKDFCPMYY